MHLTFECEPPTNYRFHGSADGRRHVGRWGLHPGLLFEVIPPRTRALTRTPARAPFSPTARPVPAYSPRTRARPTRIPPGGRGSILSSCRIVPHCFDGCIRHEGIVLLQVHQYHVGSRRRKQGRRNRLRSPRQNSRKHVVFVAKRHQDRQRI